MSRFLITVDVGNSRIKFGLFDKNERASGLPKCLNSTAVPIDGDLPWNDLQDWLGSVDGSAVAGIVAGANPSGVNRVLAAWPNEDWSTPTVLDAASQIPLSCDVDEPSQVGIDRLLGAVAANTVRPADRPALIVDSGTATTVDYVTASGVFAGGAILPGFELSARSLHHYTELLPLISMQELAAESHEPLGKATRQALRSGLFWGQLGAIRELIERLSRASSTKPLLLLTGGGASLLAPYLTQARWEPHLALQGLAVVADRLHE